jgi:hypothetical protein
MQFNDPSLLDTHSNIEAAEAVEEAQVELERLLESLWADNPSAKSVRLSPVYAIVTSKDGLTRRYGLAGFNQLESDLRSLRQAIEDQTGLEMVTVYVDDGPSLAPYGLRPVDAADPLQVKKTIDGLDGCLNEQGKEVRYLLIVGGDSIVPFHRLPNPIEDQDADVPSDNPYASRDGNYLIPERAVGRMPDGEGEGIGFLRSLIRTATSGHRQAAATKNLWSALFGALRPARPDEQNGHSLGYSASIWRKASRAVFDVIGDGRQLRTSPPLTYPELEIAGCPHFNYFNLHGIEDGANWYGQRDSLFPADYPLFPVALRPQDLGVVEQANAVVFSEACYGANIVGKDTDSSIALRFLSLQALALVGSTRIAYGSVAPPLLGADLLGRYFWEGLQARLCVGEALKYAKVNLTRAMQDFQGYLDGEDQKTLVSFVLYGDPSLPATAFWGGAARRVVSKALCPPLVCQRKARLQKSAVSDELIAAVKSSVEASLPHMAQARVHASPLAICSGDCGRRCAFARGAAKVARGQRGNWAFTLEKDIVNGEGTHRQVVKATVDEKGRILKLAVSK